MQACKKMENSVLRDFSRRDGIHSCLKKMQDYAHVLFLVRKYINCHYKDGKYRLLKCQRMKNVSMIVLCCSMYYILLLRERACER